MLAAIVCSQSAFVACSKYFIYLVLYKGNKEQNNTVKEPFVLLLTIIMLWVFYVLYYLTDRMLQTAVTFYDGPLEGQSSLTL
jgi:hypothetical protein